MTSRRTRLPFFHPAQAAWVFVVSLVLLAGTIPLAATEEAGAVGVLTRQGTGGEGAVVLAEEGRYRLQRIGRSDAAWSQELPAQPNFLQAGNEAGTIAVGHLRRGSPGEDGSPRWATVYTASGDSWSPPGEVRSIHLSSWGDRVLAQVRVESREETLVFDARGTELARFDVPQGAAHVVRFTARGDAVAVTPGPEEDSSVLETFEIATGRHQRHQLDPQFPIEDAVALDADHVVVVGAGVLTQVLFPGADDFENEGPLGWTLRTDPPGYLTLLGATSDGERLLASRGLGRFDLVGRSGEVLWSFDPKSSPLADRLNRIDLGRAHPFLHGDGTIELADDSGRGRYLLDWPTGRAPQGEPAVRWQPAAAGGD